MVQENTGGPTPEQAPDNRDPGEPGEGLFAEIIHGRKKPGYPIRRHEAYRERLGPEAGAGASAYNYLKSRKVDIGVRRRISWAAWVSNSSTTDQAEISIIGHGYEHIVTGDYAITADQWNSQKVETWLTEGEQLQIKWKSCPTDKTVEAHLTGHEEDLRVG